MLCLRRWQIPLLLIAMHNTTQHTPLLIPFSHNLLAPHFQHLSPLFIDWRNRGARGGPIHGLWKKVGYYFHIGYIVQGHFSSDVWSTVSRRQAEESQSRCKGHPSLIKYGQLRAREGWGLIALKGWGFGGYRPMAMQFSSLYFPSHWTRFPNPLTSSFSHFLAVRQSAEPILRATQTPPSPLNKGQMCTWSPGQGALKLKRHCVSLNSSTPSQTLLIQRHCQ